MSAFLGLLLAGVFAGYPIVADVARLALSLSFPILITGYTSSTANEASGESGDSVCQCDM